MPITRTIYTQGKVTLKTGALGALANFAVVSGVQNASFSMETPRENVNSLTRGSTINSLKNFSVELTTLIWIGLKAFVSSTDFLLDKSVSAFASRFWVSTEFAVME